MIVTCPECGFDIDTSIIDLRKHAYMHWNVEPRHIDRIRNQEAVRRYEYLLAEAEKADLEKDMLTNPMPDVVEKVEEINEVAA